ncbi:hypothetical protein HZA75_05710 [Candidatus Roizmanbacteria bacterium]|nr:hypothetical protein [Candidatus Roizmanbacteria bacterium]
MNREVFVQLPKPVPYAGYPPELQTSFPVSELDKQTNKAIYRTLLTLSKNIAISRDLAEGEGDVPLFDILDAGLGTDKTKAFLFVSGFSEEHKGQQIPLSETLLQTRVRIQQRDKIIGLTLLKEFFPGQFVSSDEIEKLLEMTENLKGKVVPIRERAQVPIKYVKNRLEIQKAIKEDDILNKIKKLYGEDHLDAFSQWYRVGKYRKTKSQGVVGTGNIIGSNAFNQIERVEAFLDTFASGRYQFHFTTDRKRPPLNWKRAKLWAEYRLKNQYRNNLLIERIESELEIKEKYTPEQYALMNLWLKLYKEFPQYEESKTVQKRVVTRFNAQHPGARITEDDLWAVKALFLGEAPEYTGKLETYSKRKKLQKILQSDDQRKESAQNLRTIMSKMLKEYHFGEVSMSDLSMELKLPRENLGRMRVAFERLMGYSLKRGQKDDSIATDFEEKYWPPELTDFPASIKRALNDYADPLQDLSFKQIIKKHSFPISKDQLGEVINFVLEEMPERIRKHDFEFRKRNYYWRKLNSALSETPFIKDHLTATDQDLFEIFGKSAQVDDGTQPISISQLGREYRINDTIVMKKISRIMAELEHLFGPIPETVLEEIKEKCSY